MRHRWPHTGRISSEALARVGLPTALAPTLHSRDPLRRSGGGDRRSERKRNHQHPTSGEADRRCSQFEYGQRGPPGSRESESRHAVTNPGLSDLSAQGFGEKLPQGVGRARAGNPKCFTCKIKSQYRRTRRELFPVLSRIQNIGYDMGENGRTPEWYRANHRTPWVAGHLTAGEFSAWHRFRCEGCVPWRPRRSRGAPVFGRACKTLVRPGCIIGTNDRVTPRWMRRLPRSTLQFGREACMGRKAATFVAASALTTGGNAESSLAREKPRGRQGGVKARLPFEMLVTELSLKFINLPATRSTPRLTTPSAASASASAWTCVRFGSGRPNLRVFLPDPSLSPPGGPADSRSNGCPGVFPLVS